MGTTKLYSSSRIAFFENNAPDSSLTGMTIAMSQAAASWYIAPYLHYNPRQTYESSELIRDLYKSIMNGIRDTSIDEIDIIGVGSVNFAFTMPEHDAIRPNDRQDLKCIYMWKDYKIYMLKILFDDEDIDIDTFIVGAG